MQEDPMNGDDLTKTLGSSLTRLTWTLNLWGAAITILLVITLFLAGASIRGHGL
jgi:cell division protein FtsX